MGQIFELIADHALEKIDGDFEGCHVCNRNGIDLYDYQGSFYFDNGKVDDDIFAVCAECIKTKKLAHICDFEYIKTIRAYISTLGLSIEEQEQKEKALIEKYQRTPTIPMFNQCEDRPLCCGDITEFTGYPANEKELLERAEKIIYWEEKIKPEKNPFDFREFGCLESFSDVAFFKCAHCDTEYFTFQFT